MPPRQTKLEDYYYGAVKAYNTGAGIYNQVNAARSAFAAAKPGAMKGPALGQQLKNTKLKSYLDKTYEKKCGVEVKQLQPVAASVGPTSTLATWFSPYSGIAQGLTDQTRIGNSIEVKKLQVRCNFVGHATAVCRVRIIVLKVGLMTGGVTASNDVIETSTDIQSFPALDCDSPYKILKDVTFKLTPLSTNDVNTTKYWKYTYAPKSCHAIRFTQADTTGVVGDITEGNILLKIMHDGNQPTGTFNFRAEYVDS